MSGGQVAALVFAILLLLPGGCFLLFGIGFARDDYRQLHLSLFHTIEDAGVLFAVAAVILALAGLLFWVAFHRRR